MSDDTREKEEESEDLDYAIPPLDIVAFNELRSCADINRLYIKKQLEINPDFQRGIVWSNKAQTLFIDSLIKQLPIPSLCISLDIDSQKRVVIDGLQRIYTITKFLDENDDWKLSRTDEVDSRISGKKVSEIKRDNYQLLEVLENVTIPITVLRCKYSNENHMRYLFQIFHRLNSGGSRLYNQEIRNCIYQGSFNTFLKKIVREEDWMSLHGVTEDKIDSSRFTHEEGALRFFAFYYDKDSYDGKLAVFLNNFMFRYKNIKEDKLDEFYAIFNDTISTIKDNLDIPISLGKNATDGLLVGIASNINYLKNQNNPLIKKKYNDLMQLAQYTQEALSEGVSQKAKLLERLNAAIKVFSE